MKTTSSSPSLMLKAIIFHRPLPTFPVVVHLPILHAVVVRCRPPPPSSAAIAVVLRHRCLPLPPSLPQPSSPLFCLCRLLPPAHVLRRHSPPPNLASHRHPPPSSPTTVVICHHHCCCPPPRSFHHRSHHSHSAVSGVSCYHCPFPIVVRHPIWYAFVIHRQSSSQLSALPLPLLFDCCLSPLPSLLPPLSSSLPPPSLLPPL